MMKDSQVLSRAVLCSARWRQSVDFAVRSRWAAGAVPGATLSAKERVAACRPARGFPVVRCLPQPKIEPLPKIQPQNGESYANNCVMVNTMNKRLQSLS